jgi:hypothetical protein
MDRDLKLNSIDRYVKSSPRFVLEEHGHCEVPAEDATAQLLFIARVGYSPDAEPLLIRR